MRPKWESEPVYTTGVRKLYHHTKEWWKGRKVHSLVEIANRYGTLPAGTIYVVIDKLKGLTIESLPCKKCGVKVRISRVHPGELELVEDRK